MRVTSGFLTNIRYALETDVDRIVKMRNSIYDMERAPVKTVSDKDLIYVEGKLNRILDAIKDCQNNIDRITGGQ